MTKFKLICMTFDGDYVTEHPTFETVGKAWEHAEDMGSRWYFYPFHFVVSESGKTIIDAPDPLQGFSHKRVTTVQAVFKVLSELPELQGADVLDYALAVSGAAW